MLPSTRVPFGEWLPDRPEYPGTGAVEIKNCIPQADGSYRSMKALNPFSDVAVGGIVGATSAKDPNGLTRILVGTPTSLLMLSGTAWTVVGSGFTSVTNWEFAQFGSLVLAVAKGVDPQVIDLSVVSPTFSAVSGTPNNPSRASRVAVVRDFVVLGDLDAAPRTIQWSGYNNSAIWDLNGSTVYQADSQRLFTGGRVQKVVGGPFGYVFQEREIRSLEYVGPPVIFNIQTLTRSRGTPAPNSVIEAGDRVFFLAQDGFYQVQGKQFQAIGEERVNRWFAKECAPEEIINVRGAVDRTNRIAMWAFSSVSGNPFDRMIIYNYSVNRWSYAETSSAFLFESSRVGYDLDTLATVLTAGIDVDSIPVESQAFLGGGLTIFGVDNQGRLGAFDGLDLTATLDTAEFDGPRNTRRSINGVRPFVQGGGATSVTVSLGARDLLSSNVAYTNARNLNSIGEAPILSDARYHRVRVQISGGFEHANGVDVLSRPSGRF